MCFALLKFIDLVTVVGMVGVIGVEEIKFGIIDLILTDSCFKLRPIPEKLQDIRFSTAITVMLVKLSLSYIDVTYMKTQTWQQSWLSCQQYFGLQEVDI